MAMSRDRDMTSQLQQAVQQANDERRHVNICGAGSKTFYGRQATGTVLDVSGHRGIIKYEPTELVLTARGGTPLSEIDQALRQHGQHLAFDPPHFAAGATLAGTIACGLAGPARPYSGSVRDAVLGVRCLNGRGDVLRFGGEVVKNVAGFDTARLMVGALGTLGVLLDVSLKVLPIPEAEKTLVFELAEQEALEQMVRWRRQSLPITATAYHDGRLTVRLSGVEAGVKAARRQLGGEKLKHGHAYWEALREHHHDFFRREEPLWRISLPGNAAPLKILGKWLFEWGGALRWLRTALQSTIIREIASRAGGHATLFRGGDRQGMVFHPPPGPLLELNRRLKASFDPHGIFNHGRLYPEF